MAFNTDVIIDCVDTVAVPNKVSVIIFAGSVQVDRKLSLNTIDFIGKSD